MRDAKAYLKAAGHGWWLVLAALSGAWSRLSTSLLPEEWSKQVSPELAIVIAWAAIVIGPFQAFRGMLRKTEKVQQEVERLRSDYRKAFMDEKLGMFYGEESRKSKAERFQEIKALYEPRREEVRKGDFTRASEIIPIIKHYMPVLRAVVPIDSVGMTLQIDEFKEVMDKVESHIAETMRPSQDG